MKRYKEVWRVCYCVFGAVHSGLFRSKDLAMLHFQEISDMYRWEDSLEYLICKRVRFEQIDLFEGV